LKFLEDLFHYSDCKNTVDYSEINKRLMYLKWLPTVWSCETYSEICITDSNSKFNSENKKQPLFQILKSALKVSTS